MSDIRKSGFASITGKALSSASLEEFRGYAKRASAMEGLDDAAIDAKVDDDFTYYLANAVAQLILDGKIFFSKDSDIAYDELVSMLQRPEVKEKVIRYVSSELDPIPNIDEFSDDEDRQRRLMDIARYGAIERRSVAAESMLQAIKKAAAAVKEEVSAKYPDAFNEEGEDEPAEDKERRMARHEELMKRWGGEE